MNCKCELYVISNVLVAVLKKSRNEQVKKVNNIFHVTSLSKIVSFQHAVNIKLLISYFKFFYIKSSRSSVCFIFKYISIWTNYISSAIIVNIAYLGSLPFF